MHELWTATGQPDMRAARFPGPRSARIAHWSTIASQNSPAVRLNDQDNVVVAREAIARGALVEAGLAAVADVAAGHKIATSAIPEGGKVLKYGQLIGFASRAIAPGEHVHLHNLIMTDPELANDGPEKLNWQPPEVDRDRRFLGYARGDGSIGTRNFIGIISSVNCSATVSRYIADHFNNKGGLADYPNVDGVVALTHGGGCAMNTKTEGYRLLARTLAGYAKHPNFGGILMIGLGCETNQITPIVEDF